MENKRIYEVIAKEISGEINSKERQVLKQWLSSSKDNPHIYNSIKLAWSDTKTKIEINRLEKEEIFSKIIAKASQKKESAIVPTKQQYTPALFLKIAAVITVFAVAGIILFKTIPQTEIKVQLETPLISKSVIKGQKLKIHLPDGSIVWLNSESSLSYPDRFVDSIRMVELEGEAFFEVVGNPENPFVVKSGNLITTVIGTSFNVCNYSDQQTNVSLVSGKVTVSLANHADVFYLEPGEGLNYFENDQSFQKGSFNLKAVTGWKDGILYFEDASYEEVVEALERWYGVEIISRNQQKSSWKFSGEFENEYLNIVLESISYSKKFNYTIDQNKVYVQFN